MAKPKKFRIPSKLLEQLNECSSGGFILFTFDESGIPQINSQFDSQIHASSMQFYMKNWLSGVEAINLEIMKRNIIADHFRKRGDK